MGTLNLAFIIYLIISEKLKAADDKKNDELKLKLEEALTQKQEADAQNEQLKRKMSELEHMLQSGGSPQVVVLRLDLLMMALLLYFAFGISRGFKLLPNLWDSS